MNQLTEEMRLRLSASLRHFRHLHDLSQAQAAEIAGIQKNAYTKAENGKTEPRMEWVGQLCAFYGIKPYRLFEPLEQADVAFRANRHRSESEKAKQIETVHRAIQWAQDYHWLSEVLGEKSLPLPDVSGLSPKQAAQKTLDAIWHGGLPLPEAFPDTLARYGVAVCTDPFLDTETFGFSRQVQDCGWLIAVDGAERIPSERKYWTAAHELGHILLGTDSTPHEKGSDAEENASAFASELLMPDAQFRLLWKDSAALPFYERIIRIKHAFRVPADMVLYRLTEGKSAAGRKALFGRFQSEAKRRGKTMRRDSEPAGLDFSFEGHRFQAMALEACRRELISVSRFAELCHQPYGNAVRTIQESAEDVTYG